MRTKILIFLILMLSYISCENSIGPNLDKIYITKFDIEGMKKKHLPNFELVSKQARREGREFVFQDLKDKTKIVFIRVGIHSSNAKAQYVAEDLHSMYWVIPQEDTLKVLGIGDRCWWLPDPFLPDTVAYEFIRYNIYISVNSHTYPDLLELTRAIDMDIVNDADYVDLANSISLPRIRSITSTKTVLKEGDICNITVNAYDPYNEPLEYNALGVGHAPSDPENVFRFEASRDYVPEPFFGPHILKFIVMNESNVVSETAEFTITIVQ